jgi:hypothetical protein
MDYRSSAGQQSSSLLEKKRLLSNLFSKTATSLMLTQITPIHVLHKKFLYNYFNIMFAS